MQDDDVIKWAIQVACISQISIFTRMEGTNNKCPPEAYYITTTGHFAISDIIDCLKHYNSFYDKLKLT